MRKGALVIGKDTCAFRVIYACMMKVSCALLQTGTSMLCNISDQWNMDSVEARTCPSKGNKQFCRQKHKQGSEKPQQLLIRSGHGCSAALSISPSEEGKAF
jgi:hypothetical protein